MSPQRSARTRRPLVAVLLPILLAILAAVAAALIWHGVAHHTGLATDDLAVTS
ncbi:hypothetical protein [Georgenia yuyongxinii]|uniref:hypothetical protein n=1 Tax=Georgenia yuyongxinii TaxID=2589797 RepID=UPI00163D48A0|nr:hypothetical protein [Georgenia yuyongxinii]